MQVKFTCILPFISSLRLRKISIYIVIYSAYLTWTRDACLSHDSRNWSKGNHDVKSWILKNLNPYFDKLDRIDRMTGARRLYQHPSATMSKRDKKKKRQNTSCNLHTYLSHELILDDTFVQVSLYSLPQPRNFNRDFFYLSMKAVFKNFEALLKTVPFF